MEASQSNQDKGKYVYYAETVNVNKEKTLTTGESNSEYVSVNHDSNISKYIFLITLTSINSPYNKSE